MEFFGIFLFLVSIIRDRYGFAIFFSEVSVRMRLTIDALFSCIELFLLLINPLYSNTQEPTVPFLCLGILNGTSSTFS